MANKVVKESGLAIFVKDIQVLAQGADIATLPKSNDFIVVGNIAGLVGQRPRLGEDGAYYATVDTAALVRVSNVTGQFADKATVYRKTSDGTYGTASGAGVVPVGYTDRPKTATAAGELWIQLVPHTGA